MAAETNRTSLRVIHQTRLLCRLSAMWTRPSKYMTRILKARFPVADLPALPSAALRSKMEASSCCTCRDRAKRTAAPRDIFLRFSTARELERSSSLPQTLRPNFCTFHKTHGVDQVQKVHSPNLLTLSLPRVINVKFPLPPHEKYYIIQYEELGLS